MGCLQEFVAFELLTDVDDIYCESLPHIPLKEELEHKLFLRQNALEKKCKGPKQAVYFVISYALEKFFTLIYFYFTPFWMLVIPYIYNFTAPAVSHH